MAQIATQQEALEWSKIITDWPNLWVNVQRNFQGLLAQAEYIRNNHPNMMDWYNSRLNRASELYNKANAINSSVNSIKNAYGTFRDWVGGLFGMSSLGILPAIPLAIGAAGAAVTIYEIISWLRESSLDARTIDLLKEAKSLGLTPEQAKDYLEKRGGGGGLGKGLGTLFENMGKYLPWILIGGVAIFVLPRLLKK